MQKIKAQFAPLKIICNIWLNGKLLLIVHWRKQQEYLVIRLYQDLVGDWVVSQSRGHLQASTGHDCSRTILPTYQEARSLLLTLNKQQRQLGFKKAAVAEEQLSLQFD